MSDFHASTWQTARKEHQCSCLTGPIRDHKYRSHSIRKGERYERIYGLFQGNVYSHRLCRIHSAECAAAFDFPDVREGGLDYERVREFWEEWLIGWQGSKEGCRGLLKRVRGFLRKSRK